MPYKNKEDRTEAVRRHRAKKKEEEEQIKIAELVQKKLSDILKEDFGFNTMPYSCFVEIAQEDYVVEGEKVRNRRTGKILDDIEILYGLNMMIAVETPHMTIPK
jgi:hypothetical protein